jgi:RNA polymerase sigma factor (sigma-70 family)
MRNVTACFDDAEKRPLIWQDGSHSNIRRKLVLVCADTLLRVALAELFREHFGEMDFVECGSLSDAVLRLNEAEDGWLIIHWSGDFSAKLEWLQSHFGAASRRVVVLSGDISNALERRCVEAGGPSVLADRLDAAEFLSAMQSVFAGQRIIKIQGKRDRNAVDMERLPRAIVQLNARSRTILDLLCDGRSTKEIAAALGISQRTVKWHITSLLSDLNLHSRFRVVALVTRLRCAAKN